MKVLGSDPSLRSFCMESGQYVQPESFLAINSFSFGRDWEWKQPTMKWPVTERGYSMLRYGADADIATFLHRSWIQTHVSFRLAQELSKEIFRELTSQVLRQCNTPFSPTSRWEGLGLVVARRTVLTWRRCVWCKVQCIMVHGAGRLEGSLVSLKGTVNILTYQVS